MTGKCNKCGRFAEKDMDNDKHYICEKCDLFWCFDETCHCCDGLDEEARAK